MPVCRGFLLDPRCRYQGFFNSWAPASGALPCQGVQIPGHRSAGIFGHRRAHNGPRARGPTRPAVNLDYAGIPAPLQSLHDVARVPRKQVGDGANANGGEPVRVVRKNGDDGQYADCTIGVGIDRQKVRAFARSDFCKTKVRSIPPSAQSAAAGEAALGGPARRLSTHLLISSSNRCRVSLMVTLAAEPNVIVGSSKERVAVAVPFRSLAIMTSALPFAAASADCHFAYLWASAMSGRLRWR